MCYLPLLRRKPIVLLQPFKDAGSHHVSNHRACATLGHWSKYGRTRLLGSTRQKINHVLWRGSPDYVHRQEARHVVATWLLLIGFGFDAWWWAYTSTETQPPEDARDLQPVIQNPSKPVVFARPGVAKSLNGYYRELLYKDDLRILVLHPGSFEDDIKFDMEHVTLRRPHVEYEALSYAWGSQSDDKFIYTLDTAIPVTANLYSALRYLRYEERDRILWVDALCIDQSDVEERSQQVRLMGDIFSEANRVVIWLGEEDEDATTAFHSLNLVRSNTWLAHSRKVDAPLAWPKRNFLHEIKWKSIKNLLQRPWFHRLWIVQEVAHAKRAIVVCGNVKTSWTCLSRALEYLQDHGHASRHLDPSSSYACGNVVNMEIMRFQRTRDPLFAVILANAYGGCTDPRDKIFAMMSISDGRDIFDWEISLDYTLSTYELYKRFAIWDIIRNGSLRILSCASTGPKQSELPPPLPSWVPDWTRLMDKNPLVRCETTNGFSAALETESDIWFTNDKSVLHVKGAIVDHVQTVGSMPYFVKTTSVIDSEEMAEQLHLMRQWLLEAWNIARTDRPMTSAVYAKFWTTMLCGLTGTGHPVPSSYSRHFLQYLKFVRQASMPLETYREPTHVEQLLQYFQLPWLPRRPPQNHVTPINPQTVLRPFNENFSANSRIEGSLQAWSTQKRFCRTEDGRFARVSEHAATGDSICVLHGSDVPYVLRLQEDGTYRVVGECYVHGLMHGEALRSPSYQAEVLRLQ